MRLSRPTSSLDRHDEIGALSVMARVAVTRLILPVGVAIAIEILYLSLSGQPGAKALAFIGFGSLAALVIWKSKAIGLPLMPMMAIQSLIIYGMPIVAAHENIGRFPADFVVEAGMEVLIFNLTMAVTWWVGMNLFRPSRPVSFVLQEFNKSGASALGRLGFIMLGTATLFEIFQGLNLLGALYQVMPSGSDSILQTLVSVASACGLFLISMIIGGKEATSLQTYSFVGLLIVNTLIAADGFLLAAPAGNLITVAIGLFWGGGRIPYRYLSVAILSLSFLNIGKTTMRDRYWGNEDRPAINITIEKLPGIFAEWSEASYNAIVENNTESEHGLVESNPVARNQTLLDRIDNLQNLLFVIDAIESDHIKPLYGATYALIPPLLVPRVFWPNKPRSHEGQILLNVHFGRQDLSSTLVTYIAWGLLPEAYGNFGPIAGSITLGVFLGLGFAWIENFTARKLVVSMEGFLALCLLLSLMNSFEMVASVLVTSTFQSMVVIVAASYPFVRRTVTKEAASDNE